MADEAAPSEVSLKVSFGRETLELRVPCSTTVAAAKELLASQTGVLARNAKLIHKGKVLADAQRLAACGVADGARVMLLAGAAGAASGRTAAQPVHVAASGRTVPAAVAAPVLAPDAQAARRAAWAKTGSVALRDAGLAGAVPVEVWAVGAAARVLDLCGNPRLGGISTQLSLLAGLTRLHLRSCGLRDDGVAWEALCGLRQLKTLLLDGNALTTLPDALGELQLTHLSLSANALQALPASLGRMTSLLALNASANALTALPDTLGGCVALEELDVTRNLLTALPASLGEGCARLAVLAADNNRLPAAGLPPALLRAPSLHTLSVHNNPVTVEQLRELEGYAQLEARRRAKANKAIDGRVLGASSAFDEGADASAFRKF
jgi:uncharacterized ubiquitin-like protein YukD